VLLTAVAALIVGCDDPAPSSERERGSPSSPFTVSEIPAGYRPVTAGRGTSLQEWGLDSGGTDEPYVAIRREGRGDEGIVLVSVTGFENQEGGLGQSARGNEGEVFTVDGRDAIYTPRSDELGGSPWADLVVTTGDDFAVRVTSPQATRGELLDIFERVKPRGRDRAPEVDLPEGWEEVGSVDASAAVATWLHVRRNSDEVPGPAVAHGAGWMNGEDRLAIITLPGRSADLDALAKGETLFFWDNPTIELKDVDDRRYLWIEEDRESDYADARSIWMEAPWGDLVVVSAVGVELPSRAQLLATALSVDRSSEDEWAAFVIEATGGPGLHPDEGRTEIARGEVAGLEWLLQTMPLEESSLDPDNPNLPPNVVDECIKLSNRKRECGGFSGSAVDWIVTAAVPEEGIPPYVLLSTTLDATSVRVTTNTDEATAPLHQVPGEDLWAALVFVNGPGNVISCSDRRPLSSFPTDNDYRVMRIEALDAEGAVVGCLGYGPESYEGGI
jgi:hypothetical protein